MDTAWALQPGNEDIGSQFPMHPVRLYESANMGAVPLPPLHTRLEPQLQRLGAAGGLSDAQYETACYAKQALATGGRSFFLGDATGVGKTRTCLAVVLDAALRCPDFRVLWVSCRSGLATDVQSTLEMMQDSVGATGRFSWSMPEPPSISKKRKQPDAPTAAGEFKFTTYTMLRRKAGTVAADLAIWLRKANGGSMVVFDEAHVARKTNSATQLAVLQLQRQLAETNIMYVTATAASDVGNLRYMERLGLFGDGEWAPFEDFDDCKRALTRGGVASLELVALHLKSRGLYVSRSLADHSSPLDATDNRQMYGPPLRLTLTAPQLRLYDECSRIWLEHSQQDPVTGNKTSFKQIFFLRLLVAFKAQLLIPHIHRAIADGFSVVVSLQSTGNGTCNSCTRVMRHYGLDTVGLQLPADAIDTLMWELRACGVGVAEITGRVRRHHRDPMTGELSLQRRTKKDVAQDIQDFQENRCKVAVLSAAGGFGLSLHAGTNESSRRLHMLLELPWGSEMLLQQMGRTHRTGESSPPLYRVVSIDVPVDQRVAHCVQKKMEALSALTRGDRDNQSGLENDIVAFDGRVLKHVGLECFVRQALEYAGAPGAAAMLQRVLQGGADLRKHARRTLELGHGWQEELICQIATRRLGAALDEVDMQQAAAAGAAPNTTPPAALLAAEQACGRVLLAALVMSPRLTMSIHGRWSPATHKHYPVHDKAIVWAVYTCWLHPDAGASIGRLSLDLLHAIIVRVLTPQWNVPAIEVGNALKLAGVRRSDMVPGTGRGVPKRNVFPKLCLLPVRMQRCFWDCVERASRNTAVKRDETTGGGGHHNGPTLDIVHYCFPYGVSTGCQPICRSISESAGVVSVVMGMEIDPGALVDADAMFMAAIKRVREHGPTSTLGHPPPAHPILCRTAGSGALRVVGPRACIMPGRPTTVVAWDYEVWSAGVVQPVARITCEQWQPFADAQLRPLNAAAGLAARLVREFHDSVAKARKKRSNRCLRGNRVVELMLPERALHEWGATSRILVKGGPPLLPRGIIGVAM